MSRFRDKIDKEIKVQARKEKREKVDIIREVYDEGQVRSDEKVARINDYYLKDDPMKYCNSPFDLEMLLHLIEQEEEDKLSFKLSKADTI